MSNVRFKYGKKAATYSKKDFCFSKYADIASGNALPQAPIGYGHTSLIQNPLGMLGNDNVGDCAIAGPAHEHMLTSAAGGKQITFTTEGVLSIYSAITGYNPNDPSTDQGSNVRDVLNYRLNTGFTDAEGNVHKIGAFIALEPGNWSQLLTALNLFEAVGIGIQVPESAQDQFANGQPWSVVPGAQIEGGHYIPVVARPGQSLVNVITWGALQGMTQGFYEKFCDEAWAILSPEMIGSTGVSLEGFNLAQLQADLKQV